MSRHFQRCLMVFSIPENDQSSCQSDQQSMSQNNAECSHWAPCTDWRSEPCGLPAPNHCPAMKDPLIRSWRALLSVRVIHKSETYWLYCQLLLCGIVRLRVLSIYFHTDIDNTNNLYINQIFTIKFCHLQTMGDDIGKWELIWFNNLRLIYNYFCIWLTESCIVPHNMCLLCSDCGPQCVWSSV